jgi:ATP synthase subunit 6
MILSPLEQFEITKLIPIRINDLNISITNSSIFLLIIATALIGLFFLSTYESTLAPDRWQALVEQIYIALHKFTEDYLGEDTNKFFPFIFVLFMFIAMSNLIGLIPYSFTVTSHIIITFGLSSAVFIGATIIGFREHGIHFFSLFVPAGAPLFLAPFLVIIEFVSYTSRVFSLAIRLFANMMAGHTLLKLLASFAWTMLTIGGIFYILDAIPIIIIILVTGLEFGIAFLQAYVFTVLTCIYINETIHLH